MNLKYLKRIYTLNKVGIEFLNKEDTEVLYEINRIKELLSSCTIYEKNMAYYFTKNDRVFLAYYENTKEISYAYDISKFSTLKGVSMDSVMLFIVNDILNMETIKVYRYSNTVSYELYSLYGIKPRFQ